MTLEDTIAPQPVQLRRLQRGPNSRVELRRGDPRAKLRAAIAKVTEARELVAGFEEAAIRAHDQVLEAGTAIRDAETALAAAKQVDPSDVAYSFLNREEQPPRGLAEAEAALEQAKQAERRAEEVETAVNAELEKSKRDLAFQEAFFRPVLTEVISNHPAVLAMLSAQANAWQQLRTIRTVLGLLAPYLDSKIRWDFTEPVIDSVGYRIDGLFIQQWRDALEALKTDADVQLPNEINLER